MYVEGKEESCSKAIKNISKIIIVNISLKRDVDFGKGRMTNMKQKITKNNFSLSVYTKIIIYNNKVY